MSPATHGNKDAKAIGVRLREARAAAGLSQRQLGRPTTPYTAAYISRLEAGARVPTYDALRSFAAPLGVTAEWLETGNSAPAAVELSLSRLRFEVSKHADSYKALADEAVAGGASAHAALYASVEIALASAASLIAVAVRALRPSSN